uniref:Uncharacterized protein n=1 Tax=Cryptococcus bacillisporus CA1280 TaxID=1296109 RepID=A0A0D0VMT7_CRYGA|nr:hypothetical protein I312_02447 [Cryptococcus bacillisporus CA1280]
MVDSIDFAAQRKREHPDWSYGDSADAYEVPNSTLYGHYTSQPAGHAATTPHRLCIEQEEQLILKINACASRGAIILKSLQKPPLHADKIETRKVFYRLMRPCDPLAGRISPILMSFSMLLVKDVYDTALYMAPTPCSA